MKKVEYVPIPEYHRKAAAMFMRLVELGVLVKVPMTEAEQLPDPDYGL